MPNVNDTNYSRSFHIGNTGENMSNLFRDVNNPNDNVKKNNESLTNATLKFYTDLYGKLEHAHTTYLGHIKNAELKMYSDLIGGQGKSGLVYDKYDDFYSRLEKRHEEYLKKVGGNKTNTTNVNVAGWVSVNSGKGVATPTGEANGTTNDLTADSSFREVANQLANISTNAQTSANNTYAIGTYLHKTDKENSKYSRELKDAIEKGISDSKKPTARDKENDKDRKRQTSSMKEVNSQVMDVINIAERNLVQGKYMNRLVDDVLDVVKVFQKQESVADSVVSLIMIALNSVLGWLGDGLSEIHNTQEETYKSFGLYYSRADDANEQSALYHNMMEGQINRLYNLDLENNLKSTEVWKAQAGLLEKGFSASQSEQASIENVLLREIAPNIDTNNQYLLDMQQQGMFNMTRALGGLVEYVRGISGSSRITVSSLGTIIDKLLPIEYYTKQQIVNEGFGDILGALEMSGISTEDATRIVADMAEALYNPTASLTSGNTLQRLAIAQGNYTPEDFIVNYMNNLGMFTQGTSDVLTTGAVTGAIGFGGNVWANWSEKNKEFQQNLADIRAGKISVGEEGSYSPESAYNDLVEEFATNDLFTTGEQQLENIANNSLIANDINGLLEDIALDVAFIADTLADVFHTARTLTGGEEGAKATVEEMKGLALNDPKREQYAQEAKSAYSLGKVGSDWYKYTGALGGTVYAGQKIYSGIKDKNIAEIGGGLAGLTTGGAFTYLTDIGDMVFFNKKVDKAKGETVNSTEGVSDAYLAQHPHYANGGYVKRPELAVVGDNPYGEIISPIPQLSSAVMRGVNLANKNNKPDTTDIENVVKQVGEAIVKAIAENGGSIYIDSSSGLMSGNISTRLKPIMSRTGG